MPSLETFYVFAVASAGLVLLPGPAIIYIATRGIVHGRRGGLTSMLGVECGNVLQVLAAAAGLAAIVASSAAAFSIVKYAGAAYLFFLGFRALRQSARAGTDAPLPAASGRRLFWEGLAVGALNPKLALFMLAFLPQFVDPAAGPIWLQTLALGLTFNLIALVGDTIVALTAGTAAVRLRSALRSRRVAQASGVAYISLGLWAALGNSRAKA